MRKYKNYSAKSFSKKCINYNKYEIKEKYNYYYYSVLYAAKICF